MKALKTILKWYWKFNTLVICFTFGGIGLDHVYRRNRNTHKMETVRTVSESHYLMFDQAARGWKKWIEAIRETFKK